MAFFFFFLLCFEAIAYASFFSDSLSLVSADHGGERVFVQHFPSDGMA
jgi:hypothetical protein